MKIVTLLAIGALALPSIEAAPQQRTPVKSGSTAAGTQTTPQPAFPQNAEQTRQELSSILREYPPSLRQVLQLDPSLLNSEDYLKLYPRLAEFLATHPEVVHNPSFFVGHETQSDNALRNESFNIAREIVQGLSVVLVISAIATGLVMILRTAINQSRWTRIARTQEEIHSKLMDRMASNQDLLAYIQSPAGRNFLESAPITLDPGHAGIGSPIGRILLSIQTGVVLTFAGAGLHIAFRRLEPNPATEPFAVIATLAIAVGIGFMVSAGMSYAFSKRLGLIQEKDDAPKPDLH